MTAGLNATDGDGIARGNAAALPGTEIALTEDRQSAQPLPRRSIMSDIKDKVVDAAAAVADAAMNVGHKIAEGASEAAAYVKDKAGFGCANKGDNQGVAGLKERMDVYASCGKKVGVIDHVVGNAIQLTKGDSPDGQHHFVPTAWVGRVHENHVHLTKNSAETEKDWKSDVVSCANASA